MANGIILKSGTVTAIECLHYALHLPTSVVITGSDRMEILDQAFEAARTFRPLSEADGGGAAGARRRRRGQRGELRAVQDHVDLRRDGAATRSGSAKSPSALQNSCRKTWVRGLRGSGFWFLLVPGFAVPVHGSGSDFRRSTTSNVGRVVPSRNVTPRGENAISSG